MSELDLSKFESKLESQKQTKEQVLFEKVLAAAIAADRRGFFVEPQTVKDQDQELEMEQIELVWQTSKFQRSLQDSGIATTKNLTVGTRTTAVSISVVGTGMTVSLRSGIGTVNF